MHIEPLLIMRNNSIKILLLLLCVMETSKLIASDNDSLLCRDDRFALTDKPHLLTSIIENFGINAAVYSYDRWILKRDFAVHDFKSIKENFKKGFKFDCDKFETNFFAHPYHGAYYYTAARSNNLSFLTSTASTLVGSWIWEEFAETDDPSINDILSTTFGGVALGEVMTRLSKLPLNDNKRGLNRVAREVLSAAINPMSGLNRLIYGKAWKVKDRQYLYHDREAIPYDIRMNLGYSYYNGGKHSRVCSNEPYLGIDVEYGDETEGGRRAYDNFTLNAAFIRPDKRPFVNQFCINGNLIGWNIAEKRNSRTSVSIRQDFTYYNYEQDSFIPDGRESLLRLSETAAVGIGVARKDEGTFSLFQQLQCHAVMMGGYSTDYYYRDYNMGSGFNVKYNSRVSFRDKASLKLDFAYHYLFVWDDYEKEQLEKNPDITTFNPYIARKGGDRSHASFFCIHPILDLKCTSNLHFTTSVRIFTRHSSYRYHEDTSSRYLDFRLGLSYQL